MLEIDLERVSEVLREAGPITIPIHPREVFPVVGMLQLAMRHPEVRDVARIREFADQLIAKVPSLSQEFLALGFHPPTDDEPMIDLAAVEREMADIEVIVVTIAPEDIFLLVGCLQLATRHKDVRSLALLIPVYGVTDRIIKRTPKEVQAILRRGNDPAFDC